MNSLDLKMANCRANSVPTHMFFEGFENISVKERHEVIKICASCPVKEKCLDDARKHKETYGVWGGHFFKKGKIVDIKSVRKVRPDKQSA